MRYWEGSRVFEAFTFLGRYVETDTSNIKVLQVQAQRQKKQNEMRGVSGIESNALGDQNQPSIQQQH